MKVLVADDHWIVRDSIKHVLGRLAIDVEAFEANTFEEAVALLTDNPDISLMVIDLIMPGFEEFAGLDNLRSQFPTIPIVVLSVHEDREFVLRSIDHGVVGYIPKSTNGADMMRAFELVLSGDVFFPRHILSQTGAPAAPASGSRIESTIRKHGAEDAPGTEVLTARERDVIELLGQGLSDTKIAGKLDLSPNTVRVHIRNIMHKLGLSDRAQAIHYAVKLFGDTYNLAPN